MKTSSYLLVLGERRALAWVLEEQKMAFASRWTRGARQLEPGDELILYATRGCFGNPTRDQSQVIGTAVVTSPVARLRRPIEIADRSLPQACKLRIEGVVPLLDGVDFVPLLPRLKSLHKDRSWAGQLRRPVVPLVQADAAMLRRLLSKRTRSRAEVLPAYREATHGRFASRGAN